MTRRLQRPADSYLMLGDYHKAPGPTLHILSLKDGTQSLKQALPARLSQPQHQNAMMGTWLKLSDIRKIKVLGDKEPLCRLGRHPDFFVNGTG